MEHSGMFWSILEHYSTKGLSSTIVLTLFPLTSSTCGQAKR